MSERRILSEKAFSTPSTVNIYHTPRNTENKSSQSIDLTNAKQNMNSSKSEDTDSHKNDDIENKKPPKHKNPDQFYPDYKTDIENLSRRKPNSTITSFINHRKTRNNSESSYDYALETENHDEKIANAQSYLIFRVEKLMRYLHELNDDEIERKKYFDFDVRRILPVDVRKGNLNCILFTQCLDKIMPDIEWMNHARFRRVILEEVLIGNPQVFRRLKSKTRNAWKLRKKDGIGSLENGVRVNINEYNDASSQDTCSSIDSYFETPKVHHEFEKVELNESGENTANISSENENDAEIEIKNKSAKKSAEIRLTESDSHSGQPITRKKPTSNIPVFDHKNRDFEKEYEHYESQIKTRLEKYSVYEKKLKEKQVKQIKNRIETERIMKNNDAESEIITKPVKSGSYNAEGYYEETNDLKDENYEVAYDEKYEAVINGNDTYGGNTFIDNTNNNLSHFDMMQMAVQHDYLENHDTILVEKGYLDRWLADSNFEEQTEVTPLSVISLKNDQEQELDCDKCWKKNDGDCFIQIVEEDVGI